MNRDVLIDKLNKLVEPIVKEKGYELYYLEYVKEDGENYLRIYIESDNGITLDDCANVSRTVSDMLDVEDPISDAYYLEVSSPGVYRNLHTENHFNKYIGYNVSIKLKKLFNGKKKYEGTLLSFDSNVITIQYENEELSIPRDNIHDVTLNG